MPKMKKSPLAPERFPGLSPIAGVRLGGMAANLHYRGRKDLMMAELAKGTTVAGVFSKSKMPSAPMQWSKNALQAGQKAGAATARAIVVNAGNANAFSGKTGAEAARTTAAATARLLDCMQREVFLASTGVIGLPLKVGSLNAPIRKLAPKLTANSWRDAANAIRTTDTFPKGAGRTVAIGDQNVVINGFAKGSGMIMPDMATMLSFIFTDAKIPAPVLQTMLSDANERTFNALTIDSDTSTSDTVLLFATGAGPDHRIVRRASDAHLKAFRAALEMVMLDLATQIARDGEGATKFVTIRITGAENDRAAKNIAMAVANSPLVKTAIAGEDPNWGRIVMAVGKAGEKASRDRLMIAMGGHLIAKDGVQAKGFRESVVARHMKGEEIDIHVDAGVGNGSFTAYTCDFTHGYVTINADYRS